MIQIFEVINPFLFLFIELCSSSEVIQALISNALTDISYYRDEQGYLIPVFAGSFHYLAATSDFIIGLYMNDLTYAIYDIQWRQMVIERNDDEVVLMTQELHERFDQCFVRVGPPTPPRSHPAAPNQQRRYNPRTINKHKN